MGAKGNAREEEGEGTRSHGRERWNARIPERASERERERERERKGIEQIR